MNYTEARQLALSARDHRSKPVANNTRAEIIDEHTVGIRLHGTYVVKLFEDGSFELSTGVEVLGDGSLVGLVGGDLGGTRPRARSMSMRTTGTQMAPRPLCRFVRVEAVNPGSQACVGNPGDLVVMPRRSDQPGLVVTRYWPWNAPVGLSSAMIRAFGLSYA